MRRRSSNDYWKTVISVADTKCALRRNAWGPLWGHLFFFNQSKTNIVWRKYIFRLERRKYPQHYEEAESETFLFITFVTTRLNIFVHIVTKLRIHHLQHSLNEREVYDTADPSNIRSNIDLVMITVINCELCELSSCLVVCGISREI